MSAHAKVLVIAAAVVVVVLAAVGEYAYPLYPTRRSLCELTMDRGKDPNRWASPNLGATLFVTGSLVGYPDGAYAFETECEGYRNFFAVQVLPVTLASPQSRNTLRSLAKADRKREYRKAHATMLVRISSEVQSCFGPGLIVTALALQTDGPVEVVPLHHETAPAGALR